MKGKSTQASNIVIQATCSDTTSAGGKTSAVFSSNQSNLVVNVQSNLKWDGSNKSHSLLPGQTVLNIDTVSANKPQENGQRLFDNKDLPSMTTQDNSTPNEALNSLMKQNTDSSEAMPDSVSKLINTPAPKTASTSESDQIPNSATKRLTDNCVEHKKKMTAEIIEGRRPLSEVANVSGRPITRGPTVNMNKAWQVRQAFNQSRAPVKQPLPPLAVGEGAPRYSAPQPWLTGAATSHSAHIRNRAPPPHQLMQASRVSCRRAAASTPSSSTGGRRATGSHATTELSHPAMTRSHTTLGTCTGGGSSLSSSLSGSLCSSRHSLCCGGRHLSWADKVRGPTLTPSSNTTPSSTASSASLISSQADEVTGVCGDEGWEVVRRGRRSHGGSTASLNKPQPTLLHCPTKERASNWLKRRYDVPSSATSLPSLAALTSSNGTSRPAVVEANELDGCITAIQTASFEGSASNVSSSTENSGRRRARRSTGDCKQAVLVGNRRVSLDSASLIQSVLIADDTNVFVGKDRERLDASLLSSKGSTLPLEASNSRGISLKKTRSKSFIELTNRTRGRGDKELHKSSQHQTACNKTGIEKSCSAEQLGNIYPQTKTHANDGSCSFRGKRSKGFDDSSKMSSDKHDLKRKFLGRGKAASDASIEWNRTFVRGNNPSQALRSSLHDKSTDQALSKSASSKALRSSSTIKGKRITNITATTTTKKSKKVLTSLSAVSCTAVSGAPTKDDTLAESIPLDSLSASSDVNKERGSSYISNSNHTNGNKSNSEGVLTNACSLSSRYGAIMTELYEELDEAGTAAVDEAGTAAVDEAGTAAVAEAGTAAVDEAGTAAVDEAGTAATEAVDVQEETTRGSLLMIDRDVVRTDTFSSCPAEVLFEDDLEDAAADEEIRHNAAAFENAVLEEQRLKRQIHDTENTDCDLNTDEEMVSGDEDNMTPAAPSSSPPPPPPALYQETDSSAAILQMFATLDWSEEVTESPPATGVREPGRVLQIHEKLSSPSRKLPLHEKLRRHNERLARAELQRQSLLACKSEKLKELFKRIEEVNVDKERLLEEKRHLLERKMDRAEEKRRQHLQGIVNKAHDEENKGREIAFINGLEAQNKLHDLIQQHQSHSSRLADMAEERSRRQEEKAAKEAAAQERRRALEAERQARLLELCEKRRERCERIDRQQAERREELLEQAREKARDRQERLTALVQAQQAKECELVRRIQLKQQESARRHEENIEQIKRRALESSILRCSRGCDDAPKIGRYERQKLCTLCQCLLSSEVYLLSHLRGPRHQEALRELHAAPHVSSEDTATYNLKHIVDAPDNIEDPQVTRDKERQKSLKKRCRKIRNRMATRGRDYDDTFKQASSSAGQHNKRISKALNTITKLQSNQGTGPWSLSEVAALDKSLLELLRILDKREASDQEAFCTLNGYEKLTDFLLSLMPSNASRDGEGKKKDAATGSLLLAGEKNKENSLRKVNSGETNGKNRRNNTPSKKKNTSGVGNKKKDQQQQHAAVKLSCSATDDSDDLLSTITLISDDTTEDGPAVTSCVVPSKSVGLMSRVLHTSLTGHATNCRHLLHSNLVAVLLDWLMHRLQAMALDTASSGAVASSLALPSDAAVTHTIEVLAEVLSVVSEADYANNNNNTQPKEKADAAWLRLQDMVSYCVCVGVADRLSLYLGRVQGPAPLDLEPGVPPLILATMSLLSAMAGALLRGRGSNSKDDPTQLLGTLRVTEACGVVSLLYGLLLHDGGRSSYLSSASSPPSSTSPTPGHATLTTSSCSSLTPASTPSPVHLQQHSSGLLWNSPTLDSGVASDGPVADALSTTCHQPPKLAAAIQAITVAATTLLHDLALLDLDVFQGVLGSEGISLELRHVASYLLWYCSYWPSEPILHNVIAIVGFLTVNNKENQSVVQSGETPTVLQQLCGLPWQYFSEPRLTGLLFPTLLACCTGSPHNTSVLQTEMSPQMLDDYLRDEGESCSNPLMHILRQSSITPRPAAAAI